LNSDAHSGFDRNSTDGNLKMCLLVPVLDDMGQTSPSKGLKSLQYIEMWFASLVAEGFPQWSVLEIYP
jgi:hypothetical protein